MNTKTAVVASVLAIAAVWLAGSYRNAPDRPSDLRDAVADNEKFNTAIPDIKEGDRNVPVPVAARNEAASVEVEMYPILFAAQDLGYASGKIDAEGKYRQYSGAELAANSRKLASLLTKRDKLKEGIPVLSVSCYIRMNSLLSRAQELGYASGIIDIIGRYRLYSGTELDANGKILRGLLHVQNMEKERFTNECLN